MIAKFKKIVDNKHSATIQGRIVTVGEAKCVCEAFNNLTAPFTTTFIKMPIDKIIEFSLASTSSSSEIVPKKRFNITEYIDMVQSEKLIDTVQKNEILPAPIDTQIVYDRYNRLNDIKEHNQNRVNEFINESPASVSIKEEFYQQLFEQLNMLKSNSHLIGASVNSVDFRLEKLTESNLSMMKTFDKLTKYLEKTNSVVVLQELHENMIINQRFISDHHKTLFENQTALIDNQLSLIETQKSIISAIKILSEKISLITSMPQSPPSVINVNDSNRNVTKIVERNEAGLITKIIESSTINDNDNK